MLSEIHKRLLDISAPDRQAAARARQRLDDLTKPLGSLGRMEDIIVRLSGITGQVVPSVNRPAAVLFAADHGVTEEGVSAYGPEVTEEMAVNICMGTAVSSVLARNMKVPLHLVDVGVRSTVRHPRAQVRKVGMGTANFVKGPAMTPEQAYTCVMAGIEVAENIIDAGHDLLLLGEMGIGNTTACSAMLAMLLGLPAGEVVGQGSGVSEEQRKRKVHVVSRALLVNQPDASDPWDILRTVGGFEIGALAGAMIACANRGIPVVLDGLITGTAALWAARFGAQIGEYLIASHRSPEPAHTPVLKALNLEPIAEWGMRLGEGSGALMVLPILQNTCKVMAETATFEDARVTNPHRRVAQEAGAEEAGAVARTDAEGNEGTPAPTGNHFSDFERDAVYKAILARRDIRVFLPDPVPADILRRILLAGHHAPSVGYMQPWNFIVIEDHDVRLELQRAVERERVRAAENYSELKKDYYLRLKVEGIMQAPLTICVTNDPTRGGQHVLGRHTIPETDLMSTSCAVENMWLAARAEGIAMGWVSIYQKQEVREILGIPSHIDPVALLTVGYTSHFPDIPVLERVGWGTRIDPQEIIFKDLWGRHGGIDCHFG